MRCAFARFAPNRFGTSYNAEMTYTVLAIGKRMEFCFDGVMKLDNRTGRVVGADVRVEGGDTFLFTPGPASDGLGAMPKAPEVKREAFLDFARVRADAALKSGGEGASGNALVEGLLAFAVEHGPLFGFAGLSDDAPEIREPVSDWVSAQLVMERALKAEVFSRGGEVDASEIDACFRVEAYADDEVGYWAYVFDPGIAPGELYRTCLKPSSVDGYTAEDGSILRSYWIDGCTSPVPGAPLYDAGMIAQFVTVYPAEVFGRAPWPDAILPLSVVRGRAEVEAEVASLLKIVAGKHTGGVSLDFRNPMSAVGAWEEGAYGIVCTSYLSYMWHELAQAYTRSAFRVCANPKCENVISINEETSSGKRFCSERCRAQANNAKLSAQNARAREAFYACKDYAEIYREAFGKALSFKDPERAKLCKRLDRWIEKDFAKTARGKSALKQGAASR